MPISGEISLGNYISTITLPNNYVYNLKDNRITDAQINKWDNYPTGLSSFHSTIGDGTTTSFTISHYLSTKNIIVSVNITDNNITYIAPLSNLVSSGQIGYAVTINSNDSITISFTSAPPSNGAEVSIISAIAYSSASDQNYLRIS